MADIDELFSCFDENADDQQQSVPIVLDTDIKEEKCEDDS
jgi:hypothetical protein